MGPHVACRGAAVFARGSSESERETVLVRLRDSTVCAWAPERLCACMRGGLCVPRGQLKLRGGAGGGAGGEGERV